MSKNVIASIGVVCCCVVTIFYAGGVAAEKAEMPSVNGETSFGDSIVVVFVERTAGLDRSNDSIALTDAKILLMGDRYFIRGKCYMHKQDKGYEKNKWYNGTVAAIDWKTVYQVYVFDTAKYEEYIKSYDNEAESE